VSLTRTGFKGLKLVFCEDISSETREGFTNLGFTLIDRSTPSSKLHPEMPGDWAYGIYRFLPAIEYFQARPGQFRYIIWTDVRDVVFQTNPVVWLEKNLYPHQIVVAGLGHPIKKCPWNDPWVQACSPLSYARVREAEAAACGTFAGTANTMLQIFEDIFNGCIGAQHPWATDQGMLNILLRTAPYSSIARIPRMGEGFTAQWFPDKNEDKTIYPDYGFPIFDKLTKTVYTPTGEPISILHLWDRDRAWTQIMRENYARP
jgi:hypothetical protein